MNKKSLEFEVFLDGAHHGRFKSWVDYLESFMLSADLLPTSKRAVIALSGGADSKALLLLLLSLKSRGHFSEVLAIYIDHGLRIESESEALSLKKWTSSLGVKFESRKIRLAKDSNIEALARESRYRELLKFLATGDCLYLGHHIDDSFEWYLMQSFRSSSLESSIGIPIKNGALRRPLMCLSKQQILKFLKALDIDFFSDQSNQDIRFSRNWVRHELVSKIQKQYPTYLKHYVNRMNNLAAKLNVSCFQSARFDVWADPNGGVVYRVHGRRKRNEQVGLINHIAKWVGENSESKRGKIRSQIHKLVEIDGGKSFGPMTLSGNLLAFSDSSYIYITKSECLEAWRERELELIKKVAGFNLEKHRASQIPFRPSHQNSFPYFITLIKKQEVAPEIVKAFPFTRNSNLKPFSKLSDFMSHVREDKGILWWGLADVFWRRYEKMSQQRQKDLLSQVVVINL